MSQAKKTNSLLMLIAVVLTALLPNFSLSAPPIPISISPEANEWYRWKILLSVKPHPLLDSKFRTQLASDIKAALASSLSSNTELEIVDVATESNKTDLIKAFEKSGFQAIAGSEHKQLTGIKNHFLRIELKNNLYRIESQQHDGSTGTVSPFIRVQETKAAEQISRLAAQNLFLDFGPVATIISGQEKDNNGITLKLRGYDLSKSVHGVKAGDVFMISQILKNEVRVEMPAEQKSDQKNSDPKKTPEKKKSISRFKTVYTGNPREYSYFKVITDPNDEGQFRAKVISRFESAIRFETNLVGVRAMKIDSNSTIVKVRVLGEDGKSHPRVSLLSVSGTDGDYNLQMSSNDGFAYDPREGLFKSPREMKSIACLVVGLSPTFSQRFPMPVLKDNIITIKFPIDEKSARQAELEKSRTTLRAKLGDAIISSDSLAKTLTAMINDNRSRDALDRLKNGVSTFDLIEQNLAVEIVNLKKENPSEDVSSSEELLTLFRDRVKNLKNYEKQITAMANNEPIRMEKNLRVKDLTDRISKLREEGEIPEALDVFDELIELIREDKKQQDEMKDRKEKLRKEWEPIDEPHRAAREFVLVKWPTLQTTEDYSANIKKLYDATAVMMKKNDILGVRKTLGAFNLAYARLKAITESLNITVEADEVKLNQVNAIRMDLEPIERNLSDWLKKNKK